MQKVTSILILLILCLPAYSQERRLTNSQTELKSEKIDIYFDLNSCAIDSTYMNNGEATQQLFDAINTLKTNPNTDIIDITISSYSSPFGDVPYNKALSEGRTETIYRYLVDSCSLLGSVIEAKNYGIAWNLMREYVVASGEEYAVAVVDIIDNVDVETWERVEPTDRWLSLVDSRNKQLMQLQQGAPYRHMRKEIFPYLRKSSIEIRYIRKEIVPLAKADSAPTFKVESSALPEISERAAIESSIELVEVTESKKERLPRNPIFAVKTNLAVLGLGVANIEVEVPIKDNFTVAGTAYYSPYTINHDWKIRVNLLQPELRYYLSTPMDKHFFGLHAHAGLFNVSTNQWTRYQNNTDQPLWGVGLSYGYALYLSRALSLEFNIGAGYASLCYDSFYNVENGAQYDHTQRGYWGITRAGISLNFIINRK